MPAPSTLTKSDWPPNYVSVWAWRQKQITLIRSNPAMMAGSKSFYRTNPVAFVNHWVDTYDPRNAGRDIPSRMPLIMFQRQDDMVRFLQSCLANEGDGLIEKCRDMGATWVCCAFTVWLWLYYEGASIGWGSRKEQLVDKIGDPDSIFEKIRMIILAMPPDFLPAGFNRDEHMAYMRIINPETGATVTGEAGDNIGRGGRKLIYFKDESAHYERPEKIEAALADNTRVQIDISSVNGLGNVFHRRRESGLEWEGGEAISGQTNVFVMDWSDHPAKTNEWHAARKAKAEREGLKHIFAQEVERNYAASLDGVIIPYEWVLASIDSHIALGIEPSGPRVAGLDVADEGGDLNALTIRHDFLLEDIDSWGEGDTGKTARRAIAHCSTYGAVDIQYDSVGVGAGVKAEANRLVEQELMPEGISLHPWSAGASVLEPDEHILVDADGRPDRQSPINKDFFGNLKAQGWWKLRIRFEKTYRAVNEGIEYDPSELISLPSTLTQLQQLKKELSQATASRSNSTLKLIVNKSPEGTKSPNLADSVVEAFWPVPDDAPVVAMLLRKKPQR